MAMACDKWVRFDRNSMSTSISWMALVKLPGRQS
jgi:hypothetical protein